MSDGDKMSDSAWRAAIEDRREIEGLLVRYCSAIDTKSFDRLDEIFTPDATIDYTRSGGIRGELPTIKGWLAQALAPFTMTQHMVTNVELELDGDNARCVCSFFNPMGLPKRDGSMHMFFCGGFYRDRLQRTAGGWRISERVNEQIYMYGSLPTAEDLAG